MDHRWFWSLFLVAINALSLAVSEVQESGCCAGLWVPNSFSIPGSSIVVSEKIKNETKSNIIKKPSTEFRPSQIDVGLNSGYDSAGWAGFNPGYPGRRKFPNSHRSAGDRGRNTYVTHTHYYSYVFPGDDPRPDTATGIKNNDTSEEDSGSEVKGTVRNDTELFNGGSKGEGKKTTKNPEEDDLFAEASKRGRGKEIETGSREDFDDSDDVEVFDTNSLTDRKRNGGSHHIEFFGERFSGPPKGRGRREGNPKNGIRGSNTERPERLEGRSKTGSLKEVKGNLEDGAKSESRGAKEAKVYGEGIVKSGAGISKGGEGQSEVIGKIIAKDSSVDKIAAKGVVRTLAGNLDLVGPSAPIFGRLVFGTPTGGRGIPVIGRIVVENPDDGHEVEPTHFGPDGPFENPKYQGSPGAFGNTIGGNGIGYATSNYRIHVFNQNYAPGGYALSTGGYRFDPQAPLFPPPVPITGRQFLRQDIPTLLAIRISDIKSHNRTRKASITSVSPIGMSDTEVEPVPVVEAPEAAGTPKKSKSPKKASDAPKGKRGPKPKGDKKIPPHPPTASLVTEAIENLGEKGGSSLRAIKKYIADVHKLDADRLGPFIRKYLKSAVEKGLLIQPKGKGAIGSFKLAKKIKAPAEKKKPKVMKEKAALKVKKPLAKKPKSPKKIAASIKESADKIKAAKPGSPKVVKAKIVKKPMKKPVKTPVKKPAPVTKKPKVGKTTKSPKPAASKPAAKPKATKKAGPKK
ncbi:unnamed protein product [Allacma fusca]|uniref:H15 domain-containing protein n=1 Tax=Allacma fusca TaxID=39272 RepID=A0A8J2LHC2_9HEXA|nr:unnamed protein product [Allacma fusca]